MKSSEDHRFSDGFRGITGSLIRLILETRFGDDIYWKLLFWTRFELSSIQYRSYKTYELWMLGVVILEYIRFVRLKFIHECRS